MCPKLSCILGILSSKLALKFEYVITSISLWFVEEVKNIYLFIGIYYTEFLDIVKKIPIPPSFKCIFVCLSFNKMWGENELRI